jgi:threonine/homoserine/homoserine lactone efflux protein
VAVLFAWGRMQTAHRRLRRPIEMISGSLLVGLGLRLAFKD